MSRVLVFGLSSHLGGTEVVFNTFYNFLDKKKYKFDFVARENEIAFRDEYEKDGAKIFLVPNFMKRPIKYYLTIKKIIKENKYDVVYINMLSAANILPAIAARNSNTPKIILHSHNGNTVGSVRRFLHFFGKPFLKNNCFLKLACSDAAGKFLYGNSKYTVINNPFVVDKFKYNLDFRNEIRKKYNIQEEDILLGAVGRLSPEKNSLFLIDMMSKLVDEFDNVYLMFVGSGKLKNQIISKANKYKIQNRIIIVDSTTEVYKYYSALDLFLMPSVYEGLGMSGLEAQAAGLKCVFSNSIPKEINLNNNLRIELDLNSWVEAIGKILNDKKNNRSVNVKKLEKEFGIEENGKKLLRVLDGGVK